MWSKNLSLFRDVEPSRRLPIWWHKLDAAETVSYGTVPPVFYNTNFDNDAKFTNAWHSKAPVEGQTEPGPSGYIGSNVLPKSEFTVGFWIKNGTQAYLDSIDYKTGTDQDLNNPLVNDDLIGAPLPMGVSSSSALPQLNIGDGAWYTEDDPAPAELNHTGWQTSDSVTSYGQISYSTGENWSNALSGNDGLLTINFDTYTTSGQGTADFYMLESAFNTAFSGNQSDIVIAQNGDVYKDSLSLANLVVNNVGGSGPAGGGVATPSQSTEADVYFLEVDNGVSGESAEYFRFYTREGSTNTKPFVIETRVKTGATAFAKYYFGPDTTLFSDISTALPEGSYSHLAVVKTNKSDIDSFEVYVDGVKQEVSKESDGDVVGTGTFGDDVNIGGKEDTSAAVCTARWIGSFDNIKIYDYAKRDFDDREKEGEDIPAGYTPPPYVGTGLLAWYLLEDNTAEVGTNASDVGTPTYSAAKFNNGLDTDATNYLTYPASVLDSLAEATIEFWFIPDSSSHGDTWSRFMESETQNGFYFLGNSNGTGKLEFGINRFDGNFAQIRTSTAITFVAATPIHIAATFDGAEASNVDKITIYIDGVEQTMENSNNGGNPTTFPTAAQMGSTIRLGNGKYPNPTPGVIDNLKIYNYVKTDFSDRNAE